MAYVDGSTQTGSEPRQPRWWWDGRVWLGAVLFIVGGALFALMSFLPGWLSEDWAHFLQAIGEAAAIIGGVHLLLQLPRELKREHREEENLERIRSAVSHSTEVLRRTSSSLEALHRSQVTQFFRHRAEAATDIAQDLTHGAVSQVDICGISLKEFLHRRGERTPFRDAWDGIIGRLDAESRDGRDPSESLSVRLLLIDPECNGAEYRQAAERTERQYGAGSLRDDVELSLRYLAADLRHLREQGRLEVKVYRTAPIMFLARTNHVCYIEPYFLRTTEDPGCSGPVLRYVKDRGGIADAGDGPCRDQVSMFWAICLTQVEAPWAAQAWHSRRGAG
ncbi:MAG: hypothetical protein FJX74_22305 [Armatimonadetes bacterium]|nr:hypothetical protein [Armatimonadota bacterium]